MQTRRAPASLNQRRVLTPHRHQLYRGESNVARLGETRSSYVSSLTRRLREEDLMSVVSSAIASGLTSEMYDVVSAKAMPGDVLPDGCQLHLSGPTAEGWRVIMVWDTREAFEQFREDKLLPLIRELAGGHGGPEVEPDVNPVYKLIMA
jgi:hypothetical protein